METIDNAAAQTPSNASAYAIAFEPVAEAQSGKVFAYEALLRARDGSDVSAQIAGYEIERRRDIDRKFRKAAVISAAGLGFGSSGARLIIRLLPDTIEDAFEDQKSMIEAAFARGISPSRLVLRIEHPERHPSPLIADLLAAHAKHGCLTLYGPFHGSDDEFARLTRLQPDLLSLGADEVHGLANSWSRRLHAENLIRRIETATGSVRTIATGVTNEADLTKLVGLGVRYVSGPIVGGPVIGALPPSLLARELRKTA